MLFCKTIHYKLLPSLHCAFLLTEIQTNLHIVLVMDCKNPSFVVNCQSNPAFSKKCSVQWMDSWSKESMEEVSNDRKK